MVERVKRLVVQVGVTQGAPCDMLLFVPSLCRLAGRLVLTAQRLSLKATVTRQRA
jgi:hypothetical protein